MLYMGGLKLSNVNNRCYSEISIIGCRLFLSFEIQNSNSTRN